MTAIKFCGLTEEADVALACELGVEAVGFVLWPNSPRFVEPARLPQLVRLVPRHVTPVGVFVAPGRDHLDAALDCGIRTIQLHGVAPDDLPSVSDSPVWLATSMRDATRVPSEVVILLDVEGDPRVGGTGRTIDWVQAAAIAAHRPVMLAGGLNAGNVAAAIRQVRPFGVDVSSGIERSPGKKSPSSMRAFVAAVRSADGRRDVNSTQPADLCSARPAAPNREEGVDVGG